MKLLTHAEYQELRKDATVLSRDRYGDKVLLRLDGRIIKLFRRKRLLSTALLRSYAVRFERVSIELAVRGIRSVCVESVVRVRSIRRDAVVYTMLPGLTLRSAILTNPERRDALLTKWIKMLAQMHSVGVYFRAAHFGNIIVSQDDEALAIIDVSETRFRRRALSPAMRARNFKPMLRYTEDLQALRSFGVERFVDAYVTAADLSGPQQVSLLQHLARTNLMFTFPTRDYPRTAAGSPV